MQDLRCLHNALSAFLVTLRLIWAVTCDFRQCGILTSVDSDESVQPPFKLRNSKWCSVSTLAIIEYSSDLAKALIRLHICAGWSEALLVAHTTLLEISYHGSYVKTCHLFAYRVILYTFLSSAYFFQNQLFLKILTLNLGILSECQAVWIQISPDICWVWSGSKLFLSAEELVGIELRVLAQVGLKQHAQLLRLFRILKFCN